MSNGEPDVIVDFIFEQGLFFIAIANIGEAPAYSVSVNFSHEIKGVDGSKMVSSMPLFNRIEFMPPQKTITTFLDTSASYFAHNQPLQIETIISFSDRLGKQYSNVIKHNLNIYRDIGYIRF